MIVMMVSLNDISVRSNQSLRCALSGYKDPNFLHTDSEDSDQTELMPRLILVFL